MKFNFKTGFNLWHLYRYVALDLVDVSIIVLNSHKLITRISLWTKKLPKTVQMPKHSRDPSLCISI